MPRFPRTARRGDRPPRSSPPRWATWLPSVVLVVLVGVAFGPALGNGFVGWDDPQNFLSNRLYRGLGLAQLRWALTTIHLGVYQPVAWLLLSAQWVVWRMDPRGYHLTSLALHAAVVLAVYGVTREIVARALAGSA